MNRKAAAQNEGQGALFSEQIVRSGGTDPVLQSVTQHYEAMPDGVYNSLEQTIPKESPFTDPQLVEAVHKAVVTDRRRVSQAGKHSPLQRDGTYLTVRPGDYLPEGFGAVTDGNYQGAKLFASGLEDRRLRKGK